MPALTPTDTREFIYAILNSSQRQRLETDWQLDFAYSVPGVGRYRVNAYFQRGTIGAAFRLIPTETVPIETLGLPTVVRSFSKKPRGIVLVTGPTGSGKSTTLASLINEINETRDEHIMTIEDPIEFLHSHKRCIVNQRELGADAPSFALALKAALRQDPDVILVGEMRDMETIGTALTAAETGHLVFATLHTQDAPQTIDRIIDVFPPAQQGQIRAQLAIGLQGVVTQTLIPTADGAGRCVAAEVLVPTPGVRNLIREGKTHQIYSLIQTGGQHGMQTMDASLAGLVRENRITMAVAETRSSEPGEMRKLVHSPRRPVAAGVPGGSSSSTRRPRRRRHAALDVAPAGRGRLMAAASFTYKAVDASGIPSTGEIVGATKAAVTDELKARGLTVMDLKERKSGLQMEITLVKRVKAQELTIMTRQLATMISSGMTLLRAFYVLEEQIENKLLRDTVGAVREDIESGISFSEALAKHPKIFSPLYVAMVRAGEAGGVLEESLERTADQLEKDDSLRRQVKSAMAYPTVVMAFAFMVLIGLIAFIVPVFVGVFKDFGGELPLITKFTVSMSKAVTGQWYILIARRDRRLRRLQEVAQVGLGPPAVGPPAPADPVQDRPDRAEDRARALVAHLLRALLRGRADHAGDRGHGPDGRQRRRRGRHGRGHRVGQVRRSDRRPAQGRPDLPGDGRADDRRRRGDGQPRHDAHQGRGLLRGRGGRGHQGPHVDPRAGHDRARRRHRRLHRDRDVHADVQGLRRDPVARCPTGREMSPSGLIGHGGCSSLRANPSRC